MAKRTKKSGRPKGADEPRSTLSIRLSDEERAALQAKATDLGMPETTLARLFIRQKLGLSTETL